MSNDSHFSVHKIGTVTVIEFGQKYDQLEGFELHGLERALLDLADSADPPKVVLDVSPLQFFGSAFIEVLFRVWNRVNNREGGHFGISGLAPYCREVIEITHLDRLWKLYDDRDQAVADLDPK